MKKILIVFALFNTLNICSMDKKEYAHLKNRKISNYPSYPLPKKKMPCAQEVEILAAKKKADAAQLKKELCVCFCCYLCCSTTAIASYHAGAYALGQLKNAATNYFFNTPTN